MVVRFQRLLPRGGGLRRGMRKKMVVRPIIIDDFFFTDPTRKTFFTNP